MTTAAGRRLTFRHRREQLTIAATAMSAVTGEFRTLWNPNDIVEATARIGAAATPHVLAAHTRGAETAAEYLTAFRATEGVRSTELVVTREADPTRVRRTIETSARLTALRALRNGFTVRDASRRALVDGVSEAQRLSLEGGRGTLTQSIQRDPAARGWQRITSGAPCDFCAMVAARGPAYTSRQNANFEPHKRCGCSAEAVYGRWDPPPEVREWSELWKQSTDGVSGATAMRREFRRAYRLRTGRYVGA